MMKNLFLSTTMIVCGVPVWAELPASDVPSAATAESVPVAQEVDLVAAEKIFKNSCRGCHGNKGQGASSYPKISDKEPAYIADKLERYRLGEKFGPNSVLMIQSAKKLSDEDIANISVYVSTAFD